MRLPPADVGDIAYAFDVLYTCDEDTYDVVRSCQGDAIQANMDINNIEHFNPRLKLGAAYRISSFILTWPHSDTITASTCMFVRLMLQADAAVTMLPDKPGLTPSHVVAATEVAVYVNTEVQPIKEGKRINFIAGTDNKDWMRLYHLGESKPEGKGGVCSSATGKAGFISTLADFYSTRRESEHCSVFQCYCSSVAGTAALAVHREPTNFDEIAME
ncbi:hypothetical protein Tco_0205788 [Tanacetum coccineum]